MSNSSVLIQPKRGGGRWVKSRLAQGLGGPPIEGLIVASGYASKLFPGDVLARVDDGTVKYCVGSEGSTGTPSHLMVSAKQYLDPTENVVKKGNFLPSGTGLTYTGDAAPDNPNASIVLGIPLLGQIIEFDMDEATTDWASAQLLVGLGFDIIYTAGSTAAGGYSNVKIDTSTGNNSSGQFILREVPRYGLTGAANNPAVAGWKGWFEVNSAEVDELM